MKNFFLSFFLIVVLKGFSQDTVKIKQIDRLVNSINNSQFKTHTDSTTQDLSQYKLWMKTYVTTVTDSIYLKKFTNKVVGKREEDGVLKEMLTISSFYFDQGKLIKVEEFINEDGKENHADWYYADDKPLYYTVHKEGSEERANLLLQIAKTMSKPFAQ
jgi:hypothetical protein